MSFLVNSFILSSSIGLNSWNPLDKYPNITLSNSNLTMTRADPISIFYSARASGSKSSGKYYFEITLNTPTYWGVGIANASELMSKYPGETNNSLGLGWSGNILKNGASLGNTGISAGIGDVICVAVDLDNSKMWWKKIGGAWNGTLGGDPATNSLGITITVTGPFLPMAALLEPSSLTANFGQSAYSATPPSGFSNWTT